MRKLLCSLIISLIVLSNTQAFSRATIDEERTINSLSKTQLYNVYIDQVTSAVIGGAAHYGNQLPYNFSTEFPKCIKPHVHKIFTEKDLRTLFIQPDDMDKKYFDKKLMQLREKAESCIRSIKSR